MKTTLSNYVETLFTSHTATLKIGSTVFKVVAFHGYDKSTSKAYKDRLSTHKLVSLKEINKKGKQTQLLLPNSQRVIVTEDK